MEASSSHVRPALSRARGVVDPVDVLAESVHHHAAAHDVISAELVACTLGQRERPELRLRPTGQLRVALEAIRRGLPQVR